MGVRQAKGFVVQKGKYSHYFVVTINGNQLLTVYKNKTN